MKRTAIFYLFLFFSVICKAQNFDDYKPLTNTGKLPQGIVTSSSEKYKKQIANLEKPPKRNNSKEQHSKQFYLESNFVVDDLMQSGMVLFNDEWNSYLNQVVEILLEDDADLKKKIKVYLLRSTVVNAFATDNGNIFVSMGLLAQLENEAQLAYVLSHEITHITQKHALNLYFEVQDINKSMNKEKIMNKTKFNAALLAKHRYNKELELEADKLGIDRYLKTKYTIDQIDRVYDVLQFAHLPFDEVPFEKKYIETPNLMLPSSYLCKEVKQINIETQDDSLSTHPSIALRREALKINLIGQNNAGRVQSIVSGEKFDLLQKIVRYELPMLHLHNQNFQESVYTSYLMSKEYPNSKYLQKTSLKALYGYTKFVNEDQENVFAEDVTVDSIQGEIQQVFYLLKKITPAELNMLSLLKAWELKKKYPNDSEIKAIANDLLIELHAFYGDVFSKSKAKNILDAKQSAEHAVDSSQLKKSTETNASSDNKIDKIKKQLDKKQILPNDSTAIYSTLYAFAQKLNDTAFVNAFDKTQKLGEKRKKRREYLASKEGQEEMKRDWQQKQRKGLNLNIPKVLIINPFYLSVDTRKKNSLQYIESEKKQIQLHEQIEKIAKLADLKTVILDVNTLKQNDTEKFNEIVQLNGWLSEQTAFGRITAPGYQQEKIDSIAKKYNTDYVLWSGVIDLTESKHPVINAMVIVSCLYVIPIPLAIYYFAKQKSSFLYVSILYNVKTGNFDVINYDAYQEKDTKAVMNAQLYDTFKQIK